MADNDRPTREQVLAEPAGRRLDGWVQRYVFGSTDLRMLPVYEDPEDGRRNIGVGVIEEAGAFGVAPDWCYLPEYDHDERGDIFCRVVPSYSTEIAAAWAVVEWVGLELQLEVRPDAVPTRRHAATFLREVPGGGKWTPHERYAAVGDTAPLAVCRAAILAATAREDAEDGGNG